MVYIFGIHTFYKPMRDFQPEKSGGSPAFLPFILFSFIVTESVDFVLLLILTAPKKADRKLPALSPIPLGLSLPQTEILAVRLGKELFVTPFLHKPPLVKYSYRITEAAG